MNLKNEIARVRAFLLWIFLLPFFCASTTAQEKGFYIETPYVYQVHNYCGPAALTMVLRYWERSVDQYELANRFQPFPEKGLSGAQLKELATEYGFSAYSFSGQPEAIREHLAKGRPLIVALHSSTLLNTNHFVVVVGWDPSSQEWIVQDPAGGAYQRHSARDFSSRWDKLDNWVLLVVPDSPK